MININNNTISWFLSNVKIRYYEKIQFLYDLYNLYMIYFIIRQ